MRVENRRLPFRRGPMAPTKGVLTKQLVAKDLSTASFQVAQELILRRDKGERSNNARIEALKGQARAVPK